MKKYLCYAVLFAMPGCSVVHSTGRAYSESCSAALLVATRNGSGTEYTGHSYGDSRAAAEDSHYHADPDKYDGRSSEDIPRASDHERNY